MTSTRPHTSSPRRSGWRFGWLAVGIFTAVSMVLTGCAAVTNPVADGIPVRDLPPEFIAPVHDEAKNISLTLLRQPPQKNYKVGPDDVLGIYVEGLFGERSVLPPVRYNEISNLPPGIGFPVPVQPDGTISLPYIKPFNVTGLTIDEIRELIKQKVVVEQHIVQPVARILTTIISKRRYHVSVIRQDTGDIGSAGGTGITGQVKKGSGYALDLPAGENDVLGALIRSGGTPGLDAINEVIIERNVAENPEPVRIRIPMRMRPNEHIQFRPEDVILKDGDVVFIESRDTEVFYTAGLLPPSENVLPRDYDLDILEAVARTHGPLFNGGFNSNNQFSSQLLSSGLGFPSPSLVNVLRKVGNGRQVNIRVDLNKAATDPRERILVRAGDIIVMQEKPYEAIVRYTSGIFHISNLATIISRRDDIAQTTIGGP